MKLMVMNSIIMAMISMSFILYFFSSHPMILASIVISQSVLMASLITKKILFSWFSLFIFIIYLGGILMLFSYIISLINSKKTLFWKKKMMYLTFTFFIFLNLFKEKKSFMEISTSKFSKLIMSMFSLSSLKLSIFLMIFLLLIMIMVVFLTETEKGNMRKT